VRQGSVILEPKLQRVRLHFAGRLFVLLLLSVFPAYAGKTADSVPAGQSESSSEAPAAKTTIVYLGKQYREPPPLSEAETVIADKGIQGARFSIKQANQSGQFLGHSYDLVEAIVPEDGDPVAKAREILGGGDALIIADLEPQDLLAVADLPEAKNSVIINVRTSATPLRQEQCRSNVFHVVPDWAMRADALMAEMVCREWR
jgi:hypothetical protein